MEATWRRSELDFLELKWQNSYSFLTLNTWDAFFLRQMKLSKQTHTYFIHKIFIVGVNDYTSLFFRSCWEPIEWFASHTDTIALWGKIPGVDILNLSMDLMHIKYLGIDAYYLASVLVYLVDYKLQGKAQDNLNSIWDEMQLQYQQLKSPTRLSSLTLSMIRAGRSPFPNLKAKASEVKCLVPVVMHIASKYLVSSEFEKLMYQGLVQSWAIDQCLAETKLLPKFQTELCPLPPTLEDLQKVGFGLLLF